VGPRGKLEVYNKNGKPLPDGWAVDTSGAVSHDANEILQNIIHKAGGGISPLGGSSEQNGGHKGYGLGTIVDISTAILSQGVTSNYVSREKGRADIAQFFLAMDYGLFGDKALMKRNLSVFLQELRDSSKADGQGRIYTHGEKEFESRREKLRGGIPVNDKTIAELRDIAKFHGLDYDSYFA
jgi:LDH2 family malate/lactate/ureidoglycolate dehydrogenase